MRIGGDKLYELDTLTQQLLTALHKRHRATTSELRRMIGLEGSGAGRRIRHRMDEHLIPAGVVKEVGRREHPGNDVRVFQISRDGQRAVEDEWQRLDHYLQREEVMDAQRETQERVDLLHDLHDETRKRQDDLEGDFEDIEGEFQGLQGNVSELRSRVEDLEEELEAERKKRLKLEEELESVDEETDLLAEQISEVKRIAEESWAFVNWIATKITRREYDEIQPPSTLERGRSLNAVLHNHRPRDKRDWGNERTSFDDADIDANEMQFDD